MTPALQMRPLAFARCIEIVTTARDAALEEVHWPEVRCPARESFVSLALPFAPRRWLLLDPDARRVDAARDRGCAVFNVTGKWCVHSMSGTELPTVLSAGFNVQGVLSKRRCAALYWFDCPVIVARDEDAFIVCVQSSYETTFFAALARSRSADNHHKAGLPTA